MPSTSKHVSEHIDRSPAEVYAYVAHPANLPSWALGLGSTVEQMGGEWFVETPGDGPGWPSPRATTSASSTTR